MRVLASLSFLTSAYAVKFFGGVATAFEANPPPYEVYNIAIENSSPAPSVARGAAEELRSETATLNSIAESRSRADKALEGLTAIDALHKQKLSFLQGGNSADFPVLELSLSSPTNPHPAVAANIAAAEKKREGLEKSGLESLKSAYITALNSAKAKIHGGKSSFLKFNPIEPSVNFDLVPSHSDDTAALSAIDALEAKRSAAEDAMLKSAAAELMDFGNVYAAEIAKSTRSRASFLQAVPSTAEGYHRQVNIKLIPDDSYASVSKMVANMEKRRDISEAAIRAAILDMEMSMAKSLNAFAA